MPLNYFKRRVHFTWLFFTLILFYLNLWPLAFLSLAFHALILALARKRPLTFHDDQPDGDGLVLAPVSGRVKSVRSHTNHKVFGPDLLELELRLPFWKEWGLFLPAAGEIIDTVEKKEGFYVTILRPDGRRIGVALLKNVLRSGASLNLLPGDRGRTAALFGHFSFGGKVLLYLTENCEILVQVNEQIIAGQTALAAEV
jgi:phosphatidylserine decarboxylase